MNFLHPDTAFQNPAEGMGRKAFPARTERAGSSLVEDEEAGRRDNRGDDDDADENLGGLQHSISLPKYPLYGINYQSKLDKASIAGKRMISCSPIIRHGERRETQAEGR